MAENMKVVVCKEAAEINVLAADHVAAIMQGKKDAVLGLATGSSPVGMYKELIRRYEAGELDFSEIRTINLDEYYPISPDNPQSYRYFMNENLFSHVNIDPANTHVPHGNEADVEEVCSHYEELIDSLGGADIQVLGIGGNGHIAFNEPAEDFPRRTHVVDLQESTIKANARFFEKEEDVPRQALTMGIGSIMRAKEIILIATGEKKAQAVYACVKGPITPKCPASVLQLHPNVTVFADEAAASLL